MSEIRVSAAIHCGHAYHNNPGDEFICPYSKRIDIPESRLSPHHTLKVSFDGYYVGHPLSCELFDCEFQRVASTWDERPLGVGIYRWVGNPADLIVEREDEGVSL